MENLDTGIHKVRWKDRDLETILVAWMAEKNILNWPSFLLKLVQFQKNDALHSGRRSPYEAMFGSQAACGLTSISFSTEAVDSIRLGTRTDNE